MRLLVVLHENPVGSHADLRRALASMESQGSIEEHSIFPFLSRLSSGVSPRAVQREIVAVARDFEPTAVLWCHVGRFHVTQETWASLRGLPSHPVNAYWEGDMYQWPYKPFPTAAMRVAQASDVVFIPGASSFLRSLRRCGCRDVRYAPLPTDPGRFGHAIHLRRSDPEFDVVLVGNYAASRIPLKTMPGAVWRRRIVKMLERKLGRRFGVFGYGWNGPCAQGPIPHDRQGEAYARSRSSIGVNNLSAAYYFSDRLPVSLTCGAVTLHNWECGLDQVFGQDAPIRFFRTTDEAWKAVRAVLDADEVDLRHERLLGRQLALARFTFTDVQTYMVDVMREIWQSRRVNLPPRTITNPWLHREQL